MIFEKREPCSNPKRFSLTSIFSDNQEKLYIWTDYTSGEVRFTKWDNVPEKLYTTRPVARAFTGHYVFPKSLNCSKILNYGPAAGGIGEAGAFKLMTCGERIDALIPYYGFKKRGLADKIIGLSPREALPFVERFVGQFSPSYASLFTLLTMEVPEKCMDYILLAVELERLHNHMWVIHKLSADASQKIATAHLAAMTEELLRLNLHVLGHRYGMGFMRVGPRKYENFHSELNKLKKEFFPLAEELLNSRIFIDRLQTTGTIEHSSVIKHDVIGIPARAAGVVRDARKIGVLKDEYRDYQSPVKKYGDALSRLRVRIDEIDKSFDILSNLSWKDCRPLSKEKDGFHYGFIEMPPGDAFMGVELENRKIKALLIRPPSTVLYHAFAVGIKGNVFTDFPFALDSFGIYFADADSFGRWK